MFYKYVTVTLITIIDDQVQVTITDYHNERNGRQLANCSDVMHPNYAREMYADHGINFDYVPIGIPLRVREPA